MKIAILGYGKQGQSAYEYWSNEDNEITICDANVNLVLPKGVKSRLGDGHLSNLEEFDLIVRSPIIHPNEIVKNNGRDILQKVTSATNEFFRVCPTTNIIGVTGTKGKGTTSTLIAEILEAMGEKVHLGGNIGISPLDLLKNEIEADDWVVLELANFQLIDLKYGPKIAVCLIVTPEHLDWHKTVEGYTAAKEFMFSNQGKDDIAIYYAANEMSKEIASVSPGHKIPYFAPPGAYVDSDKIVIEDVLICKTIELKLLGKHNWQNVCAALTAVWQIQKKPEAIKSVLTSFSGLEHRLELVRETEGIKYYNDSFASAPDASIAAIDAIPDNKVLILGGYDRMSSLDDLALAVKRHEAEIRKTLLIGASAQRIADAFKKIAYVNFEILPAKTMQEIISSSKNIAQPGDSIVFSPGFASFDMFKNFEDRGLQFKKVVKSL